MPTYSIPFEISGAPEGTQSFAVVLEDKDAITASGFVWIHWLIADLTRTSVAENDSIAATDYVQGANSWASVLGKLSIEEASTYGGMAPPNCRHRYELIIYALDTKLNLPQQAVACIPTNRVRGYATHPTTAGDANLKIEV